VKKDSHNEMERLCSNDHCSTISQRPAFFFLNVAPCQLQASAVELQLIVDPQELTHRGVVLLIDRRKFPASPVDGSAAFSRVVGDDVRAQPQRPPQVERPGVNPLANVERARVTGPFTVEALKEAFCRVKRFFGIRRRIENDDRKNPSSLATGKHNFLIFGASHISDGPAAERDGASQEDTESSGRSDQRAAAKQLQL
jgi:hypothetical protein